MHGIEVFRHLDVNLLLMGILGLDSLLNNPCNTLYIYSRVWGDPHRNLPPHGLLQSRFFTRVALSTLIIVAHVNIERTLSDQ